MRLNRLSPCAAALAAALAVCAPNLAQPPWGVDGKPLAAFLAPDDADLCGRARAARAMLERGLPPPSPTDEGMSDTDVLHYALEIEVFPSTTSIAGTNVMTVRCLTNGLSQFTFRLWSQLTITSARINGTTPVNVATASPSTRVATLDRPYNAGETFTLTIVYNGRPSGAGFGSFTFSTQNGAPFIDTLSEPYYAHTWWPCKDGDVGVSGDNSDKATFELAVIAPDTLSTTSNGLLVGVDTLTGARKRYRWATGYPMVTYLLAFATGRFNTWTVPYNWGGGSMPVVFNIWPNNDNPTNRAGWEKCVPMMEAFRPIFGLYPFINEKYGIYNFTFGGGMEHQTNTGQSGFSESLTSHELAHQWWGDAVTCKTWHDIWLNEGFATYAEALWEERKPGSTGLPALHSAMAARRPSSHTGTVYRTDVSSVGAIFSGTYAYRKGGWVLHQLRHVMGDDDFFAALAEWRSRYEDSAATTDDFARVCSDVEGRDMAWFFQEWVYGPGAPAYQYGAQPFAVNGRNYVRVHVQQTQSGYPIFSMPVDVRVNHAGGSLTAAVWNNAARQHYVLAAPGPVSGVVLDEFNWVLNTGKQSVAYVNGPPKVLEAAPAPGAALPHGTSPFRATVTFSENVTAVGADFALTGAGGAVPLTYAYTPGTFTATLDTAGPLAPGAYTLTVNDSVRSAAASIALDGEITAALPSGDGLAGGDALIRFTVDEPPCYADCDPSTGPGVLDIFDFLCFQNRYDNADPYACDCDTSTGRGVCDVFDFLCFQNAFDAGCP